MPTKGSPIIQVRIPAELLAEIDAQIASLRCWSPRRRWHRSALVVAAIREKLQKMARSRRTRRR